MLNFSREFQKAETAHEKSRKVNTSRKLEAFQFGGSERSKEKGAAMQLEDRF